MAFGLLALCGVQLAGLSESAHPFASVVPALLCNGAFVIVALSTTALQTFQDVQHDDTTFSHATQVKNMLAQFGIAAGVSLATLCMQWRSTLHYARLGESLSPSNPALQPTLDALTQFFATTQGAANAPSLALAQVAAGAAQEATLMASVDYFAALAAFAALCLALVLVERGARAVRSGGL